MTDKEADDLNSRRLDLITKGRQGRGLTEAESVELEELQRIVCDYFAAKYPRDTTIFDEIDARLEAAKVILLAKRAVKDATTPRDEG